MKWPCLFLGCKQEKHDSGGVLGGSENEAVVHAHHDKERLRFLHVGFPEDEPTIRCEYAVNTFTWIINKDGYETLKHVLSWG